MTVQTLLHGERLSDVGVALAAQHYEKSSLLGMDVAQRPPSELDVATDWLLSSARFRKRQMHRGTQVAALGSSNGAISSMGRAQETTTANKILTNSDSSTDHILLNAEFETVYADFLAAFPCAQSCPLPKSSRRFATRLCDALPSRIFSSASHEGADVTKGLKFEKHSSIRANYRKNKSTLMAPISQLSFVVSWKTPKNSAHKSSMS